MPHDTSDGRRRSLSLAGSLSLAALAVAPTAAARQGRQPSSVSTRELLAATAPTAATKLRRPACQAVLSDFRDPAGKALSEVLDERGLSAVEFFGSLTFLDGRAVPRCATGLVAAGTTPGSSFIAICKETFARVRSENPGLAANVLIHEMLHALGLPEAPVAPDAPTSEEITRQVTRRCGP